MSKIPAYEASEPSSAVAEDRTETAVDGGKDSRKEDTSLDIFSPMGCFNIFERILSNTSEIDKPLSSCLKSSFRSAIEATCSLYTTVGTTTALGTAEGNSFAIFAKLNPFPPSKLLENAASGRSIGTSIAERTLRALAPKAAKPEPGLPDDVLWWPKRKQEWASGIGGEGILLYKTGSERPMSSVSLTPPAKNCA